MPKYLLSFLVIFTFSFAQEPSAFGAGDLDSENPYGLTESEKKILQNTNSLKEVTQKSIALEIRMKDIEESLEGLKSVVDGESTKYRELSSELKNIQLLFENQNILHEDKLSEINKTIAGMLNLYEENTKIYDKNFEELQSSIGLLKSEIGEYAKKYATKEELDLLWGELKEIKGAINKVNASSGFEGQDNFALFEEAREQYQNKKYDDAKKRFEYTAENKYKPATSNYYLGEIAYYQKRYKDAVFHFKTSAALYDKSDYMSTLLYHTAKSFEALKDTVNAKLFYDTLAANYPDSKEAALLKK